MGKNTFTIAELDAYKFGGEPPKVEPKVEPKAEVKAEAPKVDPPVEPVTETPPVSTEPSAETPPEVEGETPPETTEPPGHMVPKTRFNQVIDERNALRKQNEYLMDLAVKAQAAPPVEAPKEVPMPTLEAAGYDTVKYTEEMKAWTQEQIKAASSKAKQEGAIEASNAVVANAFNLRMAAYAKENPKAVIALGNPNLPQLAKDAAAVVLESEIGPQILHHIANNPDEAVRIARKTPAQQAAAIGRIEGELRAKANGRKTTQAPPPPTPAKGGASPVVDPAKMSTAEWIKYDRKQEDLKRSQRKPGMVQ